MQVFQAVNVNVTPADDRTLPPLSCLCEVGRVTVAFPRDVSHSATRCHMVDYTENFRNKLKAV